MHKGKKCTNKVRCLKCSENHSTNECKNNKVKKCANCSYSNTSYKTEYKTDHYAIDSHECSILKAKIKRYIDNTNYIVKPALASFFGKVDFHNNSNTSKKQSAIPTGDTTDKKNTYQNNSVNTTGPNKNKNVTNKNTPK